LPPFLQTFATRTRPQQTVAFAYAQLPLNSQISLHTGLSYDRFQADPIRITKTHPKLGLSWQPAPAWTLRLGAYASTAANAIKEQTIEPTQFMGFNQIFDDPQGTTAKQLAFALDHRLSETTRWGWESMARRMTITTATLGEVTGCTNICRYRALENIHQLHLNQRLGTRWALNTALGWNPYRIDTTGVPLNIPGQLRTAQASAKALYFHPQGWSSYFQVRQVRQRALYFNDLAPDGRTRFTLVDLGLRYQTPQRQLSVLIDVLNVFNKKFNFQNTAIGGTPRIPLFQSGRSLVGKVEMRF
jgi:outer membrane receptor protein involved in Fe transport